MDALIIEKTGDTPRIVLDANNNIFEISDRSLPETLTVFLSLFLLGLASTRQIQTRQQNLFSLLNILILHRQNKSPKYCSFSKNFQKQMMYQFVGNIKKMIMT